MIAINIPKVGFTKLFPLVRNLLFFKLEIQTHNHSIRQRISMAFPGTFSVHLQSVMDSFLDLYVS